MAMQSGFIKRIRDIMRMDAGINGDAQRIEQMVWMLCRFHYAGLYWRIYWQGGYYISRSCLQPTN